MPDAKILCKYLRPLSPASAVQLKLSPVELNLGSDLEGVNGNVSSLSVSNRVFALKGSFVIHWSVFLFLVQNAGVDETTIGGLAEDIGRGHFLK